MPDAPICYGILMPGRHVEHGVPVIKVRNFDRGRLEVNDLLRTSEEIDSQYARSRVRAGDILISIRGTTGRVALVPDALDGANITQDSARLRVRPEHRRFVYHMLQSQFVQRQVSLHTIGQAVQGINIASVRALEIPWPSSAMRTAIVRALDVSERTQQSLADAIRAKRILKRGLMQEMLTGRRRFGGFTARAPRVALGDHATELVQRNAAGWGTERVMGVIKGVGLEPMRDHVRAADLSRYKVVPPEGFAYNPMRLNIGSIARSHLTHECLVSPDYVVFRTDPDTLLPGYLDQLRHSLIWSRFVRPAGSGGVRVRIYFRDLAEMQIPLPSLDEQQRIVGVLEGLDRETTLLEQLRVAHDQQKRAVIQRLVSGELVVPADEDNEPELAHA